jgi:asparagine synthase (glutamine-hydrolysing)
LAVIGGVWQRKSGRVRDGMIGDLVGALHAPFHGVLSAFDDERVAFAAKSLSHPAIVSHGGVVAALTGRLDGGLQAEDVLDAYRDGGNGGLETLAGDYAVAVYDPDRSVLLLLRDPVGTQPLYYAISDDVFAFGSQIKTVLAATGVPARPNHGALAQILVSGDGIPRGETCFAGVQSVPPGFAVFVTSDTVSLTAHVDLRPIVPTPLRTFEQSTAAFKRALCAGVQRRVACTGNTAVLVSGGVDSAALLAAAAEHGARDRILAISYGLSDGSNADERAHVSAVVAHAGVRSVHLDLQPLGFPDLVEADVWAGESPLIDDVPDTLRRAAAVARADDAHHLLIGTWGDQVLFPFPPPYLLEMLRAGNVKGYRHIARALGEWMADVPAPQLRRALLGQAVRGFVPPAIMDRVRPGDRQAAATFDLLRPLARRRRRAPSTHAAAVRREITTPASVDAMEGTTKWGWSHGLESQLPFLDADLLQLLFAIPAEHALHDGVPKALLRNAMKGMVPDTVLQRKDKGDYTEVIHGGLRAARAECLDRLGDGMRMVRHGLMTKDAARRTLARLGDSGEIDTSVLSSMVGLDAWLKVFFDDPAGRCA